MIIETILPIKPWKLIPPYESGEITYEELALTNTGAKTFEMFIVDGDLKAERIEQITVESPIIILRHIQNIFETYKRSKQGLSLQLFIYSERENPQSFHVTILPDSTQNDHIPATPTPDELKFNTPRSWIASYEYSEEEDSLQLKTVHPKEEVAPSHEIITEELVAGHTLCTLQFESRERFFSSQPLDLDPRLN